MIISLFFPDIELGVRKEDMMDESSNDELFTRKDIRKKKEKKRSHKASKEKEKDEYSRDSFKKMKQEIDELRKKETERAKEFEELKQQILNKECLSSNKKIEENEYALGFNRDDYLAKGFIESAQWIKTEIAKNMREEIEKEENHERFKALLVNKKASTHMGMRTCARFNRGDLCEMGKWHPTYKTDNIWSYNDARQLINQGSSRPAQFADGMSQETKHRRNEIRLHACTLCLEATMAINGHSLLNCPWILKKNWTS